MKIKISNLPEGIHKFELTKNVSELNLDEQFRDEIKLNCKVDKSLHQIVVDCLLKINAVFSCDRCNKKYNDILETNFEIVFLYDKNIEGNNNTDIKYITRNLENLDLTKEVIDYTYLSVPMKKLCDDNCKGLCPQCGANLNIKKCNCETDSVNPVWEKLISLKGKLN